MEREHRCTLYILLLSLMPAAQSEGNSIPSRGRSRFRAPGPCLRKGCHHGCRIKEEGRAGNVAHWCRCRIHNLEINPQYHKGKNKTSCYARSLAGLAAASHGRPAYRKKCKYSAEHHISEGLCVKKQCDLMHRLFVVLFCSDLSRQGLR